MSTCPREFVTDDVWRLLELVEDAEKGTLPVGGGVLDQTPGFNSGRRLVRMEEAKHKARLENAAWGANRK